MVTVALAVVVVMAVAAKTTVAVAGATAAIRVAAAPAIAAGDTRQDQAAQGTGEETFPQGFIHAVGLRSSHCGGTTSGKWVLARCTKG